MPEVYSIGLGGGSKIREFAESLTVGPDSVGGDLITKSLSMGGDTLTTTDIAVKLGILDNFGDRSLVKVDDVLANKVMQEIKEMVERALDRMKASSIFWI